MTDLVGAVVSSLAVGIVIGFMVRPGFDGARDLHRKRKAVDSGAAIPLTPAARKKRLLGRLMLSNQRPPRDPEDAA